MKKIRICVQTPTHVTLDSCFCRSLVVILVPLLSSGVAAKKAESLPVGSLSEADQVEFSRFFSNIAWSFHEDGDETTVSPMFAV